MIYSLKSNLLGLVDRMNARIDPFERLTRPLELPPGEVESMDRLDNLAAFYERELKKFLFDRGTFYSHMFPNDMGDQCIWQGVYTAMRARSGSIYSASSIDGLLTFSEYRLLRGFIPDAHLGSSGFVIDPSKPGQYWNLDGIVRKDDASLDSLAGWLYGVCTAISANATTQDQRNSIAAYCLQFIRDGCRLRNRDGTTTKHGDCRPGFFQAPVRNLATVTILRLRTLLTGDGFTEWAMAAKRYAAEFARTETHVPGRVDWENANLAVLINSAYAIVTPANGIGGAEARAGLENLLRKERAWGNAFLVNQCRALGIAVDVLDIAICNKVLSEFPLGPGNPKIPGVVKGRADRVVTVAGERCARQALPMWRRPPADFVWQRNPFVLDGGTEARYNGLDFLIAYYLGRMAR